MHKINMTRQEIIVDIKIPAMFAGINASDIRESSPILL